MAERNVLVTGIRPGGIGEAIVRRFAIVERDRVLACDREHDLGIRAVEDIRNDGGDVQFIRADVSNPDDVARVMDELEHHYRSLVVVVNNVGDAGDPARDNLCDLTLDRLMELYRANAGTAFLVTQAAVERFMVRQRGGVCLFLGSLNGTIGVLGQLGYGMAKAALGAMVKVLAADYGRWNVRFNAVLPSMVETNGVNWQKRRAADPHWAEREAALVPLGRLATPSDVADAVALVANAQFLNGVSLAVDGGISNAGLMIPGLNPRDFRASYVRLVSTVEQAAGRQAA